MVQQKTHLQLLVPEGRLAQFAEQCARKTEKTASQTIEIMNADFLMAFHHGVYRELSIREAALLYFKDLQNSIAFTSH